MASTSAEIERKFEVTAETRLPDLSGLTGVTDVRSETFDLNATYFDTPGLVLLGARITLRRRTGGADAGWHLKMPVGEGVRSETAVPLTAATDTVPVELADRVRAWVRRADLSPVAVLRTTRTITELRSASGQVLVEVADDLVRSEAIGEQNSRRAWREWEAELKDGADDDLDRVAKALLAAGAEPAGSASKLAQALGGRRPAGFPRISAASPSGEAKVVIQAYLVAQLEALEFGDGRVRADEDDSVHKMRVATRRLRSVLGTFRPALDRAATDPLREELKWLAGLLGVARDAEVQREHFAHQFTAEREIDPDLVFGGIAAWVDRRFAATYRAGHDDVLAALESDRYFALLDALDALVEHPPWLAPADRQAKDLLVEQVHKAYRQLRREVHSIEKSASATERDVRFHEARKRAKKLRYAAEALELAFGAPAEELAAAAEDVQEVLGDHQDCVVARQELRAMAGPAFLDGENTFSLGRLHAVEQARARSAEAGFADAWAALRKRRHFPD